MNVKNICEHYLNIDFGYGSFIIYVFNIQSKAPQLITLKAD